MSSTYVSWHLEAEEKPSVTALQQEKCVSLSIGPITVFGRDKEQLKSILERAIAEVNKC